MAKIGERMVVELSGRVALHLAREEGTEEGRDNVYLEKALARLTLSGLSMV